MTQILRLPVGRQGLTRIFYLLSQINRIPNNEGILMLRSSIKSLPAGRQA